jgi:hypothetical protein
MRGPEKNTKIFSHDIQLQKNDLNPSSLKYNTRLSVPQLNDFQRKVDEM